MPHVKIVKHKKRKTAQMSRDTTTSLDHGASIEQETEAECSRADEKQENGKQKRVKWMNETDNSQSTRTVDGEEDTPDTVLEVRAQVARYESGYNFDMQICLSVCCHQWVPIYITSILAHAYMSCSGRLGAAYHDPLRATLYLLEDTTDSAHFDMTQLRK